MAAAVKISSTGPAARATTHSARTLIGSMTSCTQRGTTDAARRDGGGSPSSGSRSSKFAVDVSVAHGSAREYGPW
jgi:hypothetical protein